MKKIKILAKTYDVKKGNADRMSKEYNDEEKDLLVFGLHKPIENEIWINKEIGDQETRTTLMHECLHAILAQLGYHIINSDEIFVSGVSTAISQLLIDNPKLTNMYIK